MTPAPDPAGIPATAAELLDLAKAQAAWVGECLADGTHRSWTPHLTVLTREGPAGPVSILLHALLVPFNSAEEKRAAVFEVGRRLYAQQQIPAAAVLTTEAWVAPERPGVAPADCPDRLECVVLAGCALGGRPALMQRMVVGRDPAGHILPGPWEAPVTEGIETRLLNQLWAGYFDHVARKFGWGDQS